MSEYNIIPISKVKVEQLNEFYKKTYPKRYKTLTNNWQWWYRSKHSKLRPLTLLIKDKIVGQLGLLPVDLNNDEKMISAIWLTDFAILPEYQGKGFGVVPFQLYIERMVQLFLLKNLIYQLNYLKLKISMNHQLH